MRKQLEPSLKYRSAGNVPHISSGMIQYVFIFYNFTLLEFDSNQPLLDLFISGFKPALKLSSFTYTKQLIWSFGCLHFKTAWTDTPGLSVHQYTEFTQTHVHQVSDAIQPSNPLSSASSPALNNCHHQGIFK